MGMTLRNQFKGFKANIAKKLLEAGFILEGEMHRIVAIDTGKLDQSITTDRVEENGNIFSVDVGSFNVLYAKYVEFGIGRVFNYHRPPPPGKNRPVVYRGEGQHWAERSLIKKKAEIIAKIKEAKVGASAIF